LEGYEGNRDLIPVYARLAVVDHSEPYIALCFFRSAAHTIFPREFVCALFSVTILTGGGGAGGCEAQEVGMELDIGRTVVVLELSFWRG